MSDSEEVSSEGFSASEDEWKPEDSLSGKSTDDDSDLEQKSKVKTRSGKRLQIPTSGIKKTKLSKQNPKKQPFNFGFNTNTSLSPPKVSSSSPIISTPCIPTNDDSDDESSSDSSISNYLINAKELDLSSNFFKMSSPKSPLTGQVAFKDSDSNEGLDSDDSITKTSYDFQGLVDHCKVMEQSRNLELDSNKDNHLEAKGTESMDVLSVLKLGEALNAQNDKTQRSEGGSLKSTKSKSSRKKSSSRSKEKSAKMVEVEADESDSDIDDFLEIPDSLSNKNADIKDVEILIGHSSEQRSKAEKSQSLLENSIRRRHNFEVKKKQLMMHKTSFLCLLVRTFRFNTLLNNPVLLEKALKILPGHNAYPTAEGTSSKYFQSFVTWFKGAITITHNTQFHSEVGPKNKKKFIKDLSEQIDGRKAKCWQDFVFIFVTLARGMGFQCRLIANIQPISLKPKQAELLPIKMNNKNEDEDEKHYTNSQANKSNNSHTKKPPKKPKNTKHTEQTDDEDSEYPENQSLEGSLGALGPKRKQCSNSSSSVQMLTGKAPHSSPQEIQSKEKIPETTKRKSKSRSTLQGVELDDKISNSESKDIIINKKGTSTKQKHTGKSSRNEGPSDLCLKTSLTKLKPSGRDILSRPSTISKRVTKAETIDPLKSSPSKLPENPHTSDSGKSLKNSSKSGSRKSSKESAKSVSEKSSKDSSKSRNTRNSTSTGDKINPTKPKDSLKSSLGKASPTSVPGKSSEETFESGFQNASKKSFKSGSGDKLEPTKPKDSLKSLPGKASPTTVPDKSSEETFESGFQNASKKSFKSGSGDKLEPTKPKDSLKSSLGKASSTSDHGKSSEETFESGFQNASEKSFKSGSGKLSLTGDKLEPTKPKDSLKLSPRKSSGNSPIPIPGKLSKNSSKFRSPNSSKSGSAKLSKATPNAEEPAQAKMEDFPTSSSKKSSKNSLTRSLKSGFGKPLENFSKSKEFHKTSSENPLENSLENVSGRFSKDSCSSGSGKLSNEPFKRRMENFQGALLRGNNNDFSSEDSEDFLRRKNRGKPNLSKLKRFSQNLFNEVKTEIRETPEKGETSDTINYFSNFQDPIIHSDKAVIGGSTIPAPVEGFKRENVLEVSPVLQSINTGNLIDSSKAKCGDTLVLPQLDGPDDLSPAKMTKSSELKKLNKSRRKETENCDDECEPLPAKHRKVASISNDEDQNVCPEYDDSSTAISNYKDQNVCPDYDVGSTANEEKGKGKKRDDLDFWVEIWSETEMKWIPIDLLNGKVNSIESIRKVASLNLDYVFAFQNDLSIKDITARYCPHWSKTVTKNRMDKDWLNEILEPYLGSQTERDIREDYELQQIHERKPLPKTISEFKNHPLYALQRHLLKYEALYPPNLSPIGFIRGEAIFRRESVQSLHTREVWLKSARVVKEGEEPYKIVKARPKRDKYSQNIVKGLSSEIYGYWQTQEYEPSTAENGMIPRNAYGNVDLFKESMLPKKTVHLRMPGLNRICRKLNIDCANAVTGFDFHQGCCTPCFDGFVVCEEFADTVIEAWQADQAEQERKQKEKHVARVIGNWKKLTRGLLVREYIKKKYNI